MIQTGEQYAGFWRRCLASLIDTVFFSIILLVIHVLFFGDSGMQLVVDDGVLKLESDRGFTEQIIVMAATLLMWIKFLGTPGKLVLGCHVIDAKTKQPLKPVQALVRYLGYFVSLIPLGLGFFWIAWDKKKQGFHDKIAGTIVVVESAHVNLSRHDESQKSLQQLLNELR